MSSLSKIIAGVLLAAGLVLAFVAWRLASEPSAPAPVPTGPVATAPATPAEPPAKHYPVVVAAAPIPAGTRIDADKMLKVDQWQVALSGGYSSPTPLQGAYVRVDVAAGDPLLPGMLAQGLGRQLKPGERAVAIAVDEVVGGGNRIAPGDLVDVFFMLEKGVEVQGGQARLLQSQVRVLAYGASSVDGPEEKSALPGPPGQPARTAVLAVPVEQVNELMLASRSGRLQLALRPVGDDGKPDTQLFAQRGAVLPARPDLTPEQREQLLSGPNRAYAGESLAQLENTVPTPVPAAKPAPVRATGGGGGRTVEILRGDKSERVRY